MTGFSVEILKFLLFLSNVNVLFLQLGQSGIWPRLAPRVAVKGCGLDRTEQQPRSTTFDMPSSFVPPPLFLDHTPLTRIHPERAYVLESVWVTVNNEVELSNRFQSQGHQTLVPQKVRAREKLWSLFFLPFFCAHEWKENVSVSTRQLWQSQIPDPTGPLPSSEQKCSRRLCKLSI